MGETMDDKTIWIVRDIEKYDDEVVDTLDQSLQLLFDIVGKHNVIDKRIASVPFPMETCHPSYEAHLFHIIAEGLVKLLKSSKKSVFRISTDQ